MDYFGNMLAPLSNYWGACPPPPPLPTPMINEGERQKIQTGHKFNKRTCNKASCSMKHAQKD